MPYETYIGYVDDREEEAERGDPVVLEVRDLDTFERLIVRAIIAKPGKTLDGGDALWVLDWVEAKLPDPWSIKVLEELDEEDATQYRSDITEEDLKAQAEQSQKYASGRGRGGGMPEMAGQEEARKYFENIQSRKLKK